MNQCNDPDHGAINAERSESRGLRKAWVELDDKRQVLERELTAVIKERDEARTQLALTEKNLEISTRQTEQAVQDRADEHIVFTLHWDEAQKTIESLTTTAFDLLALLGRAKSLTIPNPTND